MTYSCNSTSKMLVQWPWCLRLTVRHASSTLILSSWKMASNRLSKPSCRRYPQYCSIKILAVRPIEIRTKRAYTPAMKRLLVAFSAICLLLLPSIQVIQAKGHSSARSSASKTSKKSSKPGSDDGKYAGGKGSSHKGGHYQNPNTGNKERNRKAGVPK